MEAPPAARAPHAPAPLPALAPLPPYFDRRLIKLRAMRPDARGILAGMKIRKKLVVLHTLFSLTLAAILLVALRPAINEVVEQAEADEARVVLDALAPTLTKESVAAVSERTMMRVRSGSASELGLDSRSVQEAMATPGKAVPARQSVPGWRIGAALYTPPDGKVGVGGEGGGDTFHVAWVQMPGARAAAIRVYWLVVLALLAVYALVAVALEVVVLPQNVYAPIQRMLIADAAVQSGRKEDELIPAEAIPSDELGEIMRSRNETVVKLRQQETALADALSRLEQVANDLKRKNHLLETAQRNLAESDRLASLGMMSAGIAHELNTPLAVLKGLVEKMNADPETGVGSARAMLMLRVVGRLEKLGESLLDFARVRPARTTDVALYGVVQEAVTLVRLDRDAAGVVILNAVGQDARAQCDPDRIVQVLVNLVRNAVDAITHANRKGNGSGKGTNGGGGRSGEEKEEVGSVRIESLVARREGAEVGGNGGRDWVTITITDDGPGIDAAVLAHLFEPFVSTRLDSRGTGLGLAVAEGIVREHGGVMLARNRSDRSGAVFEVILPGGGGQMATEQMANGK